MRLAEVRRQGDGGSSCASSRMLGKTPVEPGEDAASEHSGQHPSLEPQLLCPECGSSRLKKNGLRYLKDDSSVQRWTCKDCKDDSRFSEKRSERPSVPIKENSDWSLKGENHIHGGRQVCVALARGTKNLAETEPPKSGLAGATMLSDAKIEFADQLKRDGYTQSTINACLYYLDLMERKDVNILNPEQVKGFIANQKWQNHSKATVVVYYGIFAKAMHVQWNPPRYRYEQKVPFVPLDREVNDLIAGCGRKMAVFLRLLSETGMRAGEALRLTWRDFDFEKPSVAVNDPEKGSLSRELPISLALKAMVNSLPKKDDLVFAASMNSMQSNFRRQRNRLAEKLKNPRLKQISFHTLRHFFATMLYAKDQNIIKVQQRLGHKNLNNTQIYTHLVDFKAEEYEVQIAETAEEAKKLGEAGFEHYDTIDRQHLYRKRK